MKVFRTDLSGSEKVIYFDGATDALAAFAVWKNGVRYINERTLTDAFQMIADAIELDPKVKEDLGK